MTIDADDRNQRLSANNPETMSVDAPDMPTPSPEPEARLGYYAVFAIIILAVCIGSVYSLTRPNNAGTTIAIYRTTDNSPVAPVALETVPASSKPLGAPGTSTNIQGSPVAPLPAQTLAPTSPPAPAAPVQASPISSAPPTTSADNSDPAIPSNEAAGSGSAHPPNATGSPSATAAGGSPVGSPTTDPGSGSSGM